MEGNKTSRAKRGHTIPIQPYADFGTQVAKHKEINNTTTIIHTVSANKTLYLCNLVYSLQTLQAGGACVYVRDTNDYVLYKIIQTKRQQDDGFSISINFNPPLRIPAGYDIVGCSFAADAILICFIFGYEV